MKKQKGYFQVLVREFNSGRLLDHRKFKTMNRAYDFKNRNSHNTVSVRWISLNEY